MRVADLMTVVVADVRLMKFVKGELREIYRGGIYDIPEGMYGLKVDVIGCMDGVMEVVVDEG